MVSWSKVFWFDEYFICLCALRVKTLILVCMKMIPEIQVTGSHQIDQIGFYHYVASSEALSLPMGKRKVAEAFFKLNH